MIGPGFHDRVTLQRGPRAQHKQESRDAQITNATVPNTEVSLQPRSEAALPDASTRFRNYSGAMTNRFGSPSSSTDGVLFHPQDVRSAAAKACQTPSKRLYCSKLTSDELEHVVKLVGRFPPAMRPERSRPRELFAAVRAGRTHSAVGHQSQTNVCITQSLMRNENSMAITNNRPTITAA